MDVLTEDEMQARLNEMYRVLLGHDDKRFHELQLWLFELIESGDLRHYSKKMQDKMLACLDQYRIEHRYRVDGETFLAL